MVNRNLSEIQLNLRYSFQTVTNGIYFTLFNMLFITKKSLYFYYLLSVILNNSKITTFLWHKRINHIYRRFLVSTDRNDNRIDP